jgi:predicted glycosyltransferase
MRLLIYSQDGHGLGHLRRTGNIAQRVLARVPDANVLTVVDSRAIPVVAPQRGMDHLKLPTIVKTGRSSSDETSWRPATLPLPIRDALALRSALLLHTLEGFRPDAVLVDHMPVGALGELRPALERALEMRPRPALFLGLRDVLDAPEVIRRAWHELGAYDYLPAYDAVLVYGCRHLYDADRAYEIGPHAQKVVFCNYVAPPRRGPRAPLASRAHDEEPLLLVMGGGGGDAYALLASFLDCLPLLLRSRPLRAVVLTGPNMSPADRAALVARCNADAVRVEANRDDVPSLLEAAAAVVTMAGYNSLCEVLAARKRALVVPRRGPSAEQRIRSRLFSERGLVRALDPADLEPARMAQEILALLEDRDGAGREWIPLDGAERAAQLLLETRPLARVCADADAAPST